MEELLEQIQEIQKHLYGGFKEEGATNVDWLEVRRTIQSFTNCFFLISLFFSNSL